jgi:basic membrane protein A and related proteins
MSLRNRLEGKVGSLLRVWPALLIAVLITAGGLVVIGCDDETTEGTLDFGANCGGEIAETCISGFCEPTDLGGPTSRCTQACDDSTPCPEGYCGTNGHCVLGWPVDDDPPLKVHYVYIGPIGDHGWTKAHDDGRVAMEAELGGDVEVTYTESVIPPAAPDDIEAAIADGAEVVIGTSFDFLGSLQTEAAANPDVMFLTCSGFQTASNMGSYFGRMEQVMYIMGVLAGETTTTNVVGVVGPVIIPETVRHINAFAQGVASVNSDATVVISWIGNWFSPAEDPTAEQDAVDDLVLNRNADIIFGHTDTPIPMLRVVELQDGNAANGEIADGTGPIYTIGYDNEDSCQFAPDYCISSSYWNWGPIVTQLLSEIIDGTYLPSDVVFDQILADREQSMFYYADINRTIVPDDAVITEVESLVDQMSQPTPEGIGLPFAGPVVDSEGNTVYAAGEYPTDEDLLNMCFYVANVEDTDEAPEQVPAECNSH